MSVAVKLGVSDVDGPRMLEARDRWPVWARGEPALTPVSDLLELRSWTRHADAEVKDEALRSLARLGSPAGGDDPAAIAALTWALVPGATTIAYRLADLTADVDDLVASHLWIACKTFAWQRRRSVAASILRDVLRGVQAELGIGEGARRSDRTWAVSVCHEPASWIWVDHDATEGGPDPASELLDLASSAARAGVVSGVDLALLIELAMESDRIDISPRRGRAGLMAPAASVAVADRWRISPRTARRRAARAIDNLAAYAAHLESSDEATPKRWAAPIPLKRVKPLDENASALEYEAVS